MQRRRLKYLFRLLPLAAMLSPHPVLPAQTALPATTHTSERPSFSEVQRAINNGHPELALRTIDSLPAAPGRTRLRGSALYALGRLQEADAEFAKAITEDPKDLAAIQLRGLTLFRLGQPALAIPLLEQAHSWTSETRTDPAYILALCYIDTQHFPEARRAFALQYDLPPESAAAHLLAARMLLRRESATAASNEARRALELDPGLPLAHRLLGEIALAGNHLDEATSELEKERQRNPVDGVTYDRLGDAYSRVGDYPKAQQMLERAVLLEPTSTGPYILLGKVLLKQQDSANAVGYLERAEKMDPSNYMTHSLLGQAYRNLGRMDDALHESGLSQKLQSSGSPELHTLQ